MTSIPAASPIAIDAAFDSGNIEVLSIEDTRARLAIRRDAHSDFFQWFHFRVAGAAGRRWNCASPALPRRPIPAAGTAIAPHFRRSQSLGRTETHYDPAIDGAR
jgi:hypothetical protein